MKKIGKFLLVLLSLTIALKNTAQNQTPPRALEFRLTSNNKTDYAYIQFVDTAHMAFDVADASKLHNEIFNLSTLSSDSVELSINVMDERHCSIDVPMRLTDQWEGQYVFEWNIYNENIFSRFDIYLDDNHTGERTVLQESANYIFEIDENDDSKNADRFHIQFESRELDAPSIRAEQNCENLGSGRVSLGTTSNEAVYSLLDNGSLVASQEGNGGELILEDVPFDKNSNFKVVSQWMGCNTINRESEISLNILEQPTIGYDDINRVLVNYTGQEGYWYSDGELISSEPSVEIKPRSTGSHSIRVENETCEIRSEALAITGLEDELSTISIGPNPATEHLTISNLSQNLDIRVIDYSGRTFGKWRTSGSDLTIDLNSYQRGVYILQVNSGNSYQSFKFIKQ